MVQIIGLDIIVKGDRRRLVVTDEAGQSVQLEGGKELEQIHDRFFRLNCSVGQLRAIAELLGQGILTSEAMEYLHAVAA